MFKKGNTSPSQDIENTPIDSLIGSNLKIKGDLTFSGGLRVDGSVEGDITGTCDEKSLLVLSKESQILGNVQSYNAVINGAIVGDLTVANFLELQANAVINGNINYRQLKMECGVVVDGNLRKIADEELKALPNPAAKNIKKDKAANKENNKEKEAAKAEQA